MKSDKEKLFDEKFIEPILNQLVQLSEAANMDELTQMLNRRAGKQHLEDTINRARTEEKLLSVLLYDVNELKQVNDSYGHKEGDKLLVYTSSVAKQYLGEGDFIFRLSGDEFVMVFYGQDKKEADKRVRQILKHLEEKKREYSIFYDVSFSYGITEVYPGENKTVSEVLVRADELMYIQKRNYHIMRARQELSKKNRYRDENTEAFTYDKDHLYDALTASTDDYIFVGNLKTGTFRYPQAMVEEFGLPGEIVENAAALWGELVHPHDARHFLESNHDIAEGRKEYHSIDYRVRNVRGEWIWLRCRGKMIRDESGIPDLFAGIMTNLGKKNRIDHMTGLYNRFEFEGDIKKFLVDANAKGGLGIMIMDMDSFGDINDLYNHSFGDEVLRMTAQCIASMLPPNANIYRLEGDEFGILIFNGGVEESMHIFRQIQHTFCRQQEYNGHKYFCTLSAGGAFYPKDGDNYLDLQKYANYCLEASKNGGKNRYTVFSMDILRARERDLELTELLRESIDRGFAGFSVNYQPQVDSVTGELYGAEALARWSCGKYGNVFPSEFIPLLEKSGLIIPFGAWIFEWAVEQCKAWQELVPDFQMSINLSYLQLLDGNILGFMGDILKKYGLNPGNITMELTETYFAKEDEVVLDVIQKMRDTGIKIAMDDFGVGYSSMYILKAIPVDIVKIDRGFVKDITSDNFNAAFIRSITQLCHAVGKRVCLEGVETAEQYQAVSQMGIELIQGFYFGKPSKAQEFKEKYIL